jgi:hypothetical protein
MKKIITVLAAIVLFTSMFSCKSGKSGCDAYGKVETTQVSDQASK